MAGRKTPRQPREATAPLLRQVSPGPWGGVGWQWGGPPVAGPKSRPSPAPLWGPRAV